MLVFQKENKFALALGLHKFLNAFELLERGLLRLLRLGVIALLRWRIFLDAFVALEDAAERPLVARLGRRTAAVPHSC